MSYGKQAGLAVGAIAILFAGIYLGASYSGWHSEQTGEQALERFIELDTQKNAIEIEMNRVSEKAKTEIGTKIDYFEGLRNRLETITTE